MSQREISKICADSLRNFSKEKYNTKIKAAHAHELVSAYFGYSSKNAMLADSKFPIKNVSKAKIFVMVSSRDIDIRREQLIDISNSLPDSYTLGEAVYNPLFADNSLYKSEFPPFKSFEKLAIYYVQNSERWKSSFLVLGNFDLEHIVEVEKNEDVVKLTVNHCSRINEIELRGLGQTVLTLKRVAGRVGFEKPHVQMEKWVGNARKVFKVKSGGQDV